VAGRVGVVCWKEQIRSFRAREVVAVGVKRGQHAEGDVSPSRNYGGKVMAFSLSSARSKTLSLAPVRRSGRAVRTLAKVLARGLKA